MSGIANMMFANRTPPVIAGGGDDGYASILFHFEGANASTTITNSISSGPTFTKGTNSYSYITTGEKKFGDSSFFCNSPLNSGPGGSSKSNGSGIYPTYAFANSSWLPRDHWWANDTTLESFVYIRPNTAGGQFALWYGLGTPRFNAGFWNTNSNTSFDVEISQTGTYTAGTGSAGYYYFKWTLGTGFNNAWHHVALVRYGNALKFFVDGVDKGQATRVTGSTRTSDDIFSVGGPYTGTASGRNPGNLAIADMGNYYDYGFRRSYMDEFRFSNAIARYTADFTVTSEAYTDN